LWRGGYAFLIFNFSCDILAAVLCISIMPKTLILTGFFGNRFVSIPLDRVGEMNAIRRADGSGTIQFGRPTYIPGWGDSTMNGHHYQNWRRVDPPSFEMIEDVLSVRNIIVSAQQGTYDGSGGAGG
jgi:hypothetical protein